MQEAAKGSIEVYQFEFINYREEIVQIHPQLDLSETIVDEEYEEGIATKDMCRIV